MKRAAVGKQLFRIRDDSDKIWEEAKYIVRVVLSTSQFSIVQHPVDEDYRLGYWANEEASYDRTE